MAAGSQARSGFRFAKPSLLAPLLQPEIPQAANEQQTSAQ